MCTFFPHLFSLGGRLVFLEVEDSNNEGREDGKGIRKQIVQEWNAVVRKGKVGTVLLNYIEGQALREASLRPMLLFHPNVVCVH